MAIISIHRILALGLALIVLGSPALACTRFIITLSASADGSMYAGHTNDGFGASGVGHKVVNQSTQLISVPAADHPDGAIRAVNYDPNSVSDEPSSIKQSQSKPLSCIPEVKHTYGYYTGSYGIINGHQMISGVVTEGAKVQPAGVRCEKSPERCRPCLHEHDRRYDAGQ